jgi:hypothetical protein
MRTETGWKVVIHHDTGATSAAFFAGPDAEDLARRFIARECEGAEVRDLGKSLSAHEDAREAILYREPWAMEKVRRILAGKPFERGDLAIAEITLGLDDESVTVHCNGLEVANIDLHMLTLSDEELKSWQRTHAAPSQSELRGSGT